MNNAGVIFRRTIYDNRRSILWWGIGMAALGFYIAIVFPLITQFEQFNELLESPIFSALIGDISEIDYTTPAGFLGIEFFTFLPLVLAVYAVLFGVGIVGAEEARGTLDIILSTPVPRWRLIVEKFAAFIVIVAAILLITTLGMVAAIIITPELDVSFVNLVAGMLNVIPVLALMCALALLLTTALSGRASAGGIAAGVIVASYFINSFADMADSGILKALQYVSFYKYYRPFSILTEGVDWANTLLLVGITVILFGLSLFFFERRDLSV